MIQCLSKLLASTPTWVWIILVGSQIFQIVVRNHQIGKLDEDIRELRIKYAHAPSGFTDVVSRFERIRNDKQNDLMIAVIASPVFLALGTWSWQLRRKHLNNTKITDQFG